MTRRVLLLGAWLGAILLGQEALMRVIFPLPDVPSFNRSAYAAVAAGAPAEPLLNSAFVWSSEPDGMAVICRLNLYGFRDPVSWPPGRQRGGTRTAFFGDSMVEGLGTDDHLTIPEIFERVTGREALNLGVAGTGPAQYLRLARDALSLFRPDDAILVLYDNDLPAPVELPPEPAAREWPRANPWRPRLLRVIARASAGLPVPRAWHTGPWPFFPAVPDPLNPLSARAPGYEPFIEPFMLEAMRRGTFNPYLADELEVAARTATQPANAEPLLAAFHRAAKRWGVALRVVYLPRCLQVSDEYRTFALRYSVIEAGPLTGEEYQRHAREVAAACRDQKIPFLDLTPLLRAEESAGRRLYWSYDNHLRPEGYELVARAIASWVRKPRR